VKHIYKEIHLEERFFWIFAGVSALFICSFFVPFVLYIAQGCLILLLVAAVFDGMLLFMKKQAVTAKRISPKIMSLGDENRFRLSVEQAYTFPVTAKIIDELPAQFQKRDFELSFSLKAGKEINTSYLLTPSERGEYHFGNINIHISSFLQLVSRHFSIDAEETVQVYPSIIQMKKYELKAFATSFRNHGLKKIRKIGHSYEFEQIKNYVPGDDTRSINWKASGRKGELMANQYEDERSQQIYTIIDKSRSMKMPFNKMSLLDHSINTSLVLSNLILKKHDKAGLLTFSDKIDSVIMAEKGNRQLHRILQSLYNEKEGNTEANYELLYNATRNMIKGRSLLFLYTNFESIYSLQRVLPILRKLNRFHLLVVMFFDNSELSDFANLECKEIKDIYDQTMAKRLVHEKELILQELQRHGIQAIKSSADSLSINTINKFLELKARGMI